MTGRHPATRLGSASTALLIASCDGGALDPAGEGARRIADLWWVMFALGAVAMVVIVALLIAVIVRGDRPSGNTNVDANLSGGVVFSVLLLIPVMAMTVIGSIRMGADDDGITIEVTGHQFWWDLVYDTGETAGTFRSANEIHIPVDRDVTLEVTSADVIHSFWVPELDGKIDLIPGRTNRLEVRAEQPGVFRGQCAEFCGIGHANMRLLVVAQPADEFATWARNEMAPAEVDVDTGTLEGFADSCAPCHTVRGLFDDEAYQGDRGPDLTGIASRRMLAGNIMPNTVEGLARWISDPHGTKPGSRMPDVGLDGDELDDVIDLLGRLD